jgi:hypothetical protein
MRRIVLVLVAIVTFVGVVASMPPAPAQADGAAAPISGARIPQDTATGG